jgi:L-methionine (R)-S-oxide reductase
MKTNDLLNQAQSLLSNQPTDLSRLANASAFLYASLDEINWVGFYLFDGKDLTVGPFQGNVACAFIPFGKGVCGEAAKTLKTQVVSDVLQHDNHIACDARSRSEVVIPLIGSKGLYGVLDVDSPVKARFDEETVRFLQAFAQILMKTIDF